MFVAFVQLAELDASQGGVNFIQAVIITEGGDIVAEGMAAMAVNGAAGHSVGADNFYLRGIIVIVCADHASFAGGNILIGKKRKTGNVAYCAQFFPR